MRRRDQRYATGIVLTHHGEKKIEMVMVLFDTRDGQTTRVMSADGKKMFDVPRESLTPSPEHTRLAIWDKVDINLRFRPDAEDATD